MLNTHQVRLLLNISIEVYLLTETLWVASMFITRKNTSKRCKLLREYWFLHNPYEFFPNYEIGEDYYRMLVCVQNGIRDSVFFAVAHGQRRKMGEI